MASFKTRYTFVSGGNISIYKLSELLLERNMKREKSELDSLIERIKKKMRG